MPRKLFGIGFRGVDEAAQVAKAGLWFRRGRLVMVSPVHGIMPQSGRKSTYPICSDCPSQLFNQEKRKFHHARR
jgi:hypothetical protein